MSPSDVAPGAANDNLSRQQEAWRQIGLRLRAWLNGDGHGAAACRALAPSGLSVLDPTRRNAAD